MFTKFGTTAVKLIERVNNKALREISQVLRRDWITGIKIAQHRNLKKIGTSYGGWVIPADSLDSNAICYCAGVGEDITFDIGLIERFGCDVFAFDPTPRAIIYVSKTTDGCSKYHFFPIGLWDDTVTLKFYAPANPQHVSHSALNLQRTADYFEAPCKRLSTLMAENGHTFLHFLKIDIEGAEYKVLQSIIDDAILILVLCVEYDEAHHPIDNLWKSRISSSISALLEFGYVLVNVDGKSNFTFIKKGFA